MQCLKLSKGSITPIIRIISLFLQSHINYIWICTSNSWVFTKLLEINIFEIELFYMVMAAVLGSVYLNVECLLGY